METCDFGKFLQIPCNRMYLTRSTSMKNINELSADEAKLLLWRAGLLDKSITNICLHHEKMFGHYFERKNQKCCGILKKHVKKAKGQKLISLQMAEHLQEKNIDIIPGYKLCRNCLKEFELHMQDMDQTEMLDHWMYDGSILGTPKRRLDTSLIEAEISPINLHAVATHSRRPSAERKLTKVYKKFRHDISSVYDVDSDDLNVDCTDEDEPSEEINEKMNELIEIYDSMKEKLKSADYTEKVQVLTIIPNSWSRKKCTEFFGVSEHSVRISRDLKEKNGILARPNPRKGKKLPNSTMGLIQTYFEDDEYSRLMPGKKDCVSIGENQYKQKRLLLCNLRELFVAFKEKHSYMKISFSKFCSLRPKWCIIAGADGTHSVCVCSQHQNAILLVDAMNWNMKYKDFIQLIVCSETNRICMMHRCDNCPGAGALKDYLDSQLSDFHLSEEFHYYQWLTTDRATLNTITTTCEEYKKTLLQSIQKLTKHSYLAKCQARFLKEKKASLLQNEAVVLLDFAENHQFIIQDAVQAYHWGKNHCTIHPLVVYYRDAGDKLTHKSFCFVSNDSIHDTSFVYEVQTQFTAYIKNFHTHIKKLYYFSDGCVGQYKNFKNLLNLCHHKHDFGLEAQWIFFAAGHGKSPCDAIGGTVKRYVTKRSLQRPLNNQIINYEHFLEICKTEISGVFFFGINRTRMIEVRQTLQQRYCLGKTIPGTRSSHHFIPLSKSRISHKLTSEDIDSKIFDFGSDSGKNLDDFHVSMYISCVYNTFWWIGVITEINLEQSDLKIELMHPHGPKKTFTWPEDTDSCYVTLQNILCCISPPSKLMDNYFQISDVDYSNIMLAHENFGKT